MGLGKDVGAAAVAVTVAVVIAVVVAVTAGVEELGCAGELLPVEVGGNGGEVTVSTLVGVSNIA